MARTSDQPLQVEENIHIFMSSLWEAVILVVLVSVSGIIHNKVIRVADEFTQAELDHTASYLNVEFHGKSLATIRSEIVELMKEEKALYDQLLRNAMLLCSQSLQDGDQPDVFIEGASNIIAKPDFSDTERMRALFKMFEQKGHSRVDRPLTNTSPDVGRSIPLVSFSAVLFPDPLRPSSTKVSPASTLPGGISNNASPIGWRYCRTRTTRPSSRSGTIPTEGTCSTTSARNERPSSSRTSSTRSPTTRPWNTRWEPTTSGITAFSW